MDGKSRGKNATVVMSMFRAGLLLTFWLIRVTTSDRVFAPNALPDNPVFCKSQGDPDRPLCFLCTPWGSNLGFLRGSLSPRKLCYVTMDIITLEREKSDRNHRDLTGIVHIDYCKKDLKLLFSIFIKKKTYFINWNVNSN